MGARPAAAAVPQPAITQPVVQQTAEAVNAAQQAAIAIAKKKKVKK